MQMRNNNPLLLLILLLSPSEKDSTQPVWHNPSVCVPRDPKLIYKDLCLYTLGKP